jgi:hypothetical protein
MKMNEELAKDIANEFHTMSNRQKSMQPKSHTKHWCYTCDRDLVHEGEKCSTCGVLNGKRLLKKDKV